MLKIIKKIIKSILFFAWVPRGCDVALGAMWQRQAGPRGAYAVHIHYIHIVYILYKGYSAFRRPEGYSNPLTRRDL